MHRLRKMITGGLFLVSIALLGIAIYVFKPFFYPADPLLGRAFEWVSNVQVHKERVDTTLFMPDQTLHVTGIYLIDERTGSYASYSTTTLSFKDQRKPIVFSLANISIGEDVYVKVDNKSGARLSVESDGAWRHFRASQIPETYQRIATVGPTLDNRKLFSDGGVYLTLIGKAIDAGDARGPARYTFKLSGAQTKQSGTLAALLDRIGAQGTIEALLDRESGAILQLRFENHSYRSTTTIELDESLAIAPPIVFK